ncbi:MAG: polysaccharide biosynthesis protein [Magnetovibrio sp.]|nr:polysaccharide biosynthesis protein [Magnetovibrio sp.]
MKPRNMIAFGHDVIMAALSFGISMVLRFGDVESVLESHTLIPGTIIFTATATIVFLSLRMYRGIWRYASMNELFNLSKAVTVLMLIFAVEMFILFRLEGIPRSVPIINWFVLLAMLGGPRFLYRTLKDRRYDWHLDLNANPKIPVLLVGAGDEAEVFIRSAQRAENFSYRPVGIVSETEGRVGRFIHNVEVLGTVNDIVQVVSMLKDEDKPQRLVLSKDTIQGASVRDLLKTAQSLGLTIGRMPRVDDLQSGDANEVRLRPIAIEDLLGRPQQPLDRDAMVALVKDRRVLVTGAGGSIGSELVRQVAEIGPTELVMVENSEFALYLIDQEISKAHPNMTRHAVIADVRDRARVDQIFARYKPELVFHAAALKHVPLVEDNPCEGIRTNATGSRNVADACEAAGVNAMVMISTDKAVNPTNIMGATKRIAETYVQALDLKRGAAEGTRFVTVRFGNVLGSTGSVVPLFTKQLEAGGPLTVTHPDMTRYFMTIHEAVELILQASALGVNNHATDGKLFVLDMGESVKIVELARQMIRLAGLEPDVDIEIQYTGPRPGEKLFEEIFHGAEPPVPTDAPGVLLASPRTQDVDSVRATLDKLDQAARDEDLEQLMDGITTLVPEYAPPAKTN